MSFEAKLPEHYKAVIAEYKKLDYERMEIERLLRHTDPCDCECDGCEEYCQGRQFDDIDEDIEELEQKLEYRAAAMLDCKLTKERLERYAKARNITLETTKP